jgi:hypothetical protein
LRHFWGIKRRLLNLHAVTLRVNHRRRPCAALANVLQHVTLLHVHASAIQDFARDVAALYRTPSRGLKPCAPTMSRGSQVIRRTGKQAGLSCNTTRGNKWLH